MHAKAVIQRLTPKEKRPASRYAIIDCAATQADDTIYSKLSPADVEKYNLFTGEMAAAVDHAAPFLVPLRHQPELEAWLLAHGWGNNWGIFFSSKADLDTLLGHFRRYLKLQAPNGRDVFFRFYDALILHDLLSSLSQQEAIAFFGPVCRFVVEDPQGAPLVFEKPEGELSESIDPSELILGADKRAIFSKQWRARLLDQHAGAYRRMGFDVTADAAANAITIEDKAGATAQMQKTDSGVNVTTGEQRLFQYELTACKHPAAITDPAGNRIDLDIQERDNKEKRNTIPILNAIRMASGQTSWVFDYDEMHHLERIDYPDGTRTQFSHDGYGNLTGVVDRNGSASQYEYDFDERLIRFEDANGHSTLFDYDDLTAPSTIAFADGAAFGFEYTDAGALEKFLANNTQVADYQVDKESGSWQVNYTDGGHAEFVVEADRIVRASNAAGTVALAYDGQGHLIKETFQNRTITYHRNETAQLTGITTPFGETIHYTRDKEGRVSSIRPWSGPDLSVSYAPSGAMEKISYPNGTCLEQETNAQGLPTEMVLRGPQGTLFYKTFQRDKMNRVTGVKDGDQRVAYHYDKEGRLLKALSSSDDMDERFTIDAKANRLADNGKSYVYNKADRLTDAGSTSFQYDNLGNLTQGTCPRGGADYTYTDLNRLKSITLKSGRAQYLYDAFGRRVAKKVNGVTTRYFWAQSQLLHEARYDTADKKSVGVTDYLFFPETPVLLAIRQNRQIHWAAFGHRYEVLCLTDAGGNLVWQAQYDAFGKARVAIGEKIHQPFRLPGQYYDPESGLHYNLARYYDPSLGRFISLDPLFLEGGSSNFYTYCNGDPINHIDPSGELIFCLLVGFAIGAAVGGLLEGARQHRNNEATDGFKIAKAALIGGVIGAIGGGVGAALEAAVGAGALGTSMAASTVKAMAAVGFLSGAGSSVAEQCAEAKMTGNGADPLPMTQQALTDGVIGAVLAPLTFAASGFFARRLRKASALFQPATQSERAVELAQKNKQVKSTASPEAQTQGAQTSNHADKSSVGEPVNAITGEVILSQTDFTLPGRIPLSWTRHYGSQCEYDGLLGRNWQTPADARLEVGSDGLVTFYDGSPGGAVFDGLPTDSPIMEVSDGAMLSAVEDAYQVRLKTGLVYYFPNTLTNDQTHLSRISDASGNYLAFDRKEGELTQIRDNSGQCIRIACRRGRIISMQLHDKPLVSYRYDRGQLVAAIDALGGQKRFYYKSAGLVRHMDTNKLSFYYKYDDSGRCIHTWGDGGLYENHLEHRPYERSVVVTDSLGHTTTYHYDKDRLPVKTQDQNGAAIIYAYDQVGRVIKVTDPLERATEYVYDDAGNVLEIIRPDSNRVVFVYDDRHRPIQTLDANGKIWEQRFDDKGRLIKKISPLDERTQYSYNHNGDPITMTDPKGQVTAFTYDDNGLVSAITHGQNRTTRYQRDLLGNITAIIDPAGQETRYVYDPASRLIQTVQASGIDQRFAWDGEDNLLLHTDPDGNETHFEYGGVNEIIRRINADGSSVTYQYDTEENLLGVTNEKNDIHRFQYDHAGRVIAQTDYYGHTTHYTYDPAGKLIESRDPLARTIAYAYDLAGRLLAKTFDSEEQETFAWDANGNLTTIQSPDALVERFYDAANRLIAEKNGDVVVAYTYDPNGRRTGRTTSHGNNVTYSYDPMGALTALRINEQDPITIERNVLGQITQERFSDHLTRRFVYNDAGRLSLQSISGAAGDIERMYNYDGAGNLTDKYDNNKGSWQYSYDPMGRIIESIDPEHQIHRFGYDPTGDRLEHLPDTGHALRSALHNHTEYRFDAAGNLAERVAQEEVIRFGWDEQNRLKTARKADDTRITMAYDALGRRQFKAVNGERTFFHWDGDALLSEQSEDGQVKEYVYYPGTFEPLAVIDGSGEVYYYHNDLNGLPQEVTRPNGDIVWSANYDAIGQIDQILAEEIVQPLRMQGQYYDAELDLCYNRNRYYDPKIGSFISQDPLGLAAGENVYAYAPNVWGWVDPLGLCPKSNRKSDLYVNSHGQAVPSTGYRAVGGPAVDRAKAGNIMSDKDTYFSFDDVTGKSGGEVKELFQLKYPPSHVAEFDTLQIIDDIEIPAAKWNTLRTDSFVMPEPITNSYPQFGKGGATQAITNTPIKNFRLGKLK